ncbi:MAG: serine hydroxymethyltransferase [Chloroflexi bacterium UTCFX4]|nr:MAG: serine hydroxymethyltransferase [Chloroflexi bacterium UTCFX4]
MPLEEVDPEIAVTIESEKRRQREGLELIASENYVSRAVLTAVGSVLTNKYAEGYPGKRYYNGCEFVDDAEALAIARAKKLFGADHANVQPHSGSQANFAAYVALIQPGDTVLAMSLAQGGHLTHGALVNITGQLYKFVGYGVNKETEQIDYAELEKLALEHKPKLIVSGATAYPRKFDFERIRAICDKVGAKMMVDMAHIAGLIAGKVHPDPVPYAEVVTTTTHKTLRGPRGGMILCKESEAKAIDKAIFPGTQGGPLEHVIAGKAVAFQEALLPEFQEYARRIVENAQALGARLQARGLRVISGGTDNHLLLVDVSVRGVTGKDAANRLHDAGITANKNLIPFDTAKATITSGIRLGTPALTSRGMGVEEMAQVGDWIADVIEHRDDDATIQRVRAQVREFCLQYPVPGIQDE